MKITRTFIEQFKPCDEGLAMGVALGLDNNGIEYTALAQKLRDSGNEDYASWLENIIGGVQLSENKPIKEEKYHVLNQFTGTFTEYTSYEAAHAAREAILKTHMDELRKLSAISVEYVFEDGNSIMKACE